MKQNLDRSVWINYFNEFNERNQSRPTQLEVFGEYGAQKAECGLSFAGISLERGNGSPAIEIMLGGPDNTGSSRLTHVINDVQQIIPKHGQDGRDEALEIVGEHGEISLLRFETWPMIAGN
jgi:hypothetical protein